jgi:transcription elongation GreA/GreB family factor
MSRPTFEEYRRGAAGASLEDDWIAEAERDPADGEWFLGSLENLVADGEIERARSLYELWDEELRRRALWSLRLEALRRIGPSLLKANRLQKEALAAAEGIWGEKPNFVAMVNWLGLRKLIDEPAKLWDKLTRLSSLLVYDVGEIVSMQGQGVGRVAEVNLALETLKIDFEKKPGVTLGFRAAAKMLRPLPVGHPLRRKIEDPEGLARLRDEQPAELLRAVLESAEKPLSGAEIRDALAGIVSEVQWTSWWAAARRHPQLVAFGSGRQSYRWESSASGALDAVRRSFDRANPRRKMDIFRKNADRDPGLAANFAGDLASIASEAAASDPGLAWEIFFLLERAGRLPKPLVGLVDLLLGSNADPRPLLAGIEDRLLRERALTMVRERREDWKQLYRDWLGREEDPRVLSLLAQGLAEADVAAHERWIDDLVAQPRRAPAAFAWIAERAADDEVLRARSPLRLLQQILATATAEEFSGYRARLRALLDSGGTVPRLIAALDSEQAPAALEALERATTLEPYQRDPAINALRLRFPALVDAAAATPLYATSPAIDSKRAELKRLAEVEIPANRKAIEEARALGDLRENFEYKSARQRHEYLNARLAALHRDLGRVRPIDFRSLDTAEVRIGARVRLLAEDGRERSFAVLGPWESRPEEGIVSYESELGQRLLGLKPGDRVEVGDQQLSVAAIEPAG